jgi:ferric-dicitrate binding protein FerR (iron transport regulator)
MDHDHFIALYTKKLTGELSVAEQEELRQVMADNEDLRLLAIELDNFQPATAAAPHVKNRLNEVWAEIRLQEQAAAAPKIKPLKRAGFLWQKIAAGLLLMLTVGGGLFYKFRQTSQPVTYTTLAATGEKIFQVLPDGTKVWLNRSSQIRYSENFGRKEREIFLSGEAFFDVAANAVAPMLIHARNIDVQVLGTAFNIDAYENNKHIEVTLVNGRVEVVSHEQQERKILLNKSKKLIIPVEQATVTPAATDWKVTALKDLRTSDIKWASDTLVFRKQPMIDLSAQLELKYGVRIIIQNPHLKNVRFSGTLADASLQDALEALKLSNPFTYTIENNIVNIH